MDNTLQTKALRYSIIDGGLSSTLFALFSGVFVTGFALNVFDADLKKIGILSALPILANFIQLFSAYMVQRTGKKKTLCISTMMVSRILLLVIILLPLALFQHLGDSRIWILVFIIAFSSFFTSFSKLAWASWISDLVPANIRGRFFGKRSRIASTCSICMILSAGAFLSFWGNRFGHDDPYGYVIVFSLGALAGFAGIWFSTRIPASIQKEIPEKEDFKVSEFLEPFKDYNFRVILFTTTIIRFALMLSGTFHVVYMIKHLQIDFGIISIFIASSSIASIIMVQKWGKLVDKFGVKPVAFICLRVLSILPVFWIFVHRGNYFWLLLILYAMSGASMSATQLMRLSAFLEIASERRKSVYLSLLNAIPDLFACVAPILGAYLATSFADVEFHFWKFTFINLHILFLTTALLRSLTLNILFPRITGLGEAKPTSVILELGKSFDFTFGLSGVSNILTGGKENNNKGRSPN